MDGGIAAYTEGLIGNCYNAGKVKTSGGWLVNTAGGLTGRLIYSNINNCYNYGEIVSQDGYYNTSGGIVGQYGYSSTNQGKLVNSYCTNTSATYSYWYSNTTHYTNGRITESELKGYASTLNEKDEEGNEIEVWVNDTGINDGYPILKWQIEH